MKNFFEKLGKFTFSVILTGLIVTWAVYAAVVTIPHLKNNEIVTESFMTNLADTINAKLSKNDVPTCKNNESLSYNWSSFSCKAQILPAIELKSVSLLNNVNFSTASCNSWTTAISCGVKKIDSRDEDSLTCAVDPGKNRCIFYKDQSGWFDWATGYCNCIYYPWNYTPKSTTGNSGWSTWWPSPSLCETQPWKCNDWWADIDQIK